MATVNKIEVGDGLRPTGGLSQMAATAQAQRTQNAALGYQQQQDAKIQPGAGKAWQQEQQEYAAVENNLIKARTATEAEAQQARSMLARARREGRHDVILQAKNLIRDIDIRRLHNEKALAKHQFIRNKLYQYLMEVVSWEVVAGQYYSAYHNAIEAKETGMPAYFEPEF